MGTVKSRVTMTCGVNKNRRKVQIDFLPGIELLRYTSHGDTDLLIPLN